MYDITLNVKASYQEQAARKSQTLLTVAMFIDLKCHVQIYFLQRYVLDYSQAMAQVDRTLFDTTNATWRTYCQ